jgi:hypothetical protein
MGRKEKRRAQRDKAGRLPRASPAPAPARGVDWGRFAGTAALAAALVFALCLAWRPIGSVDIGYHLAYGDSFFRTGRIVDGNDFVYTDFDPAQMADPANTPPGAWYDSRGQRYRFPNSNYASQLVMSLVYRTGGFAGLCVLQVTLVAAVMLLMLLTMRRLAVPRTWMAVGCLLAAHIFSERMNLRPEVFGYVFLTALLFLLSAPRISRPAVVMIVALQWAFVQFHISWFLGLAVAGAFLAEALLQAAWARVVRRESLVEERRRRLTMLAVAVGGMVAAVFVNPWTWRLAALPIQTASYMRTYVTAAGAAGGGAHPWAAINEFQGVFDKALLHTRVIQAFVVVLALSAVGAAAALRRRKWAFLFLLGGMMLISLSMRRAITPGGLVMLPVALALLADLVRRSGFGKVLSPSSPRMRWVGLFAGLLVFAAAAYWVHDVVTDRFYYTERRPWRFGAGAAPRYTPMAAAGVLRSTPADARVFTSFNASSVVMYFGRHGEHYRPVPILTNTWAYLAPTMSENHALCTGKQDFVPYAAHYDVQYVVLECSERNKPLLTFLLGSPDWTPVNFDGWNVLFARSSLNMPSVLGRFRDLEPIVADIKANERRPAFSLHLVGTALYTLGFYDQAEMLFRKCLACDERYFEAWTMLGAVLSSRGLLNLNLRNSDTAKRYLLAARQCLRQAVAINPGYFPAEDSLRRVQQKLSEIGQ